MVIPFGCVPPVGKAAAEVKVSRNDEQLERPNRVGAGVPLLG
jgi:hypothetical protein